MTPDEAKAFADAMQDIADTAARRATLHLKMATILFKAEFARALIERGALSAAEIAAVCDAVGRRAEENAKALPQVAQDAADIATAVRLEIAGEVVAVHLN